MKRTFVLFLILTLLVDPSLTRASKISEHLPEAIISAIRSLKTGNNPNLNFDENAPIPLKRFIRSQKGSEAAALETMADGSLLTSMSRGTAVMLLSQYEALNKYLEESLKEFPDAHVLQYQNLDEGLALTKQAIAEKREHIFNAVFIYAGILTYVPHMYWDKHQNTYVPVTVKGHKQTSASPLNNDGIEVSFMNLVIYKTLNELFDKKNSGKKTYPMSKKATIHLMPSSGKEVEININPIGYLPEIYDLVQRHKETLGEYFTQDRSVHKSQHRTSLVTVSKARELILFNLHRQNDVSLVPHPMTKKQKKKLEKFGYKTLKDISKIDINSSEFEKLCVQIGLRPKRFALHILRARAWTSPPFDSMRPEEFEFFANRSIYNVGDLAKFDSNYVIEDPLYSGHMSFPEIDAVPQGSGNVSIAAQRKIKQNAKNKIIEEFSEELDISPQAARRRINHFLKQARHSNHLVKSKEYQLPQFDKDIYLDIEDFQNKTYLIGVADGSEFESFKYFVAQTQKDLDSLPWRQFLKYFKDEIDSGANPGIHIYSPHEIILFTKFLNGERRIIEEWDKERLDSLIADQQAFIYTDNLGQDYGVYVGNTEIIEEFGLSHIKRVYGAFHDLLPYFRNNLQGPFFSNSLKQIATYFNNLGLNSTIWTDRDANGLNSIAWFQEFLRTKDPKVLARIVRYNAIDVLVMPAVLNILKQYERTPLTPDIQYFNDNFEVMNSIVGKQVSQTLKMESLSELKEDIFNLFDSSKLTLEDVFDLIQTFDVSEMRATVNRIKFSGRQHIEERDLLIEKIKVERKSQMRQRLLTLIQGRSGKYPMDIAGNASFARLMQKSYLITPKKLLNLGFLLFLEQRQDLKAITDNEIYQLYIDSLNKYTDQDEDSVFSEYVQSFLRQSFPEVSRIVDALKSSKKSQTSEANSCSQLMRKKAG